MTDYIKRKEVINAIEKETYRHDYLEHVIDIVESMPSADVTPIHRGKAIFKYDGNWYCSECGYKVPDAHDYCNWCGAKLIGDGK